MQAVLSAVDDTFYKIASEGLVVLNNLIQILCPLGKQSHCYGDQLLWGPMFAF